MRKIAADYAFLLDKGPTPFYRPLISIDERGKILAIEQWDDADLTDNRTEYYKGTLVPGFVNSHCHIELSHLKGVFEEATGMSGFINQINKLRESVDEEGRLTAMKTEFENFSKQGIVAVSDISNCAESFALKKYYLNLLPSNPHSAFPIYFKTFVELFGTEKEDADNILESGLQIVKKAVNIGLDAGITPHSCYTMSPQLLTMAAVKGLETGYISYHSQESQEEEDLIMNGSGALADNYKNRGLSTPPVTHTTALEYFINLLMTKQDGSLEKIGGNINLVHNVVISQTSIDKAMQCLKNPFFTICPLSNIFIHRELPPIRLMLKNSLKICIGTDSLSSNHILNMVKEMLCLQEHFPDITLSEMLLWACSNGAEYIGKQDIMGSLSVGKIPGVVLLENLHNFCLTPESSSRRLA